MARISTTAVFILILSLAASPGALAQTKLEIVRSDGAARAGSAGDTHYTYRFENSRFSVPLQELEFDGAGHGTFKFKRKDEDEIVNNLQLTPPVLDEIRVLFSSLNFLSSTEEYQHKKDFSHLGTTSIVLRQWGRERKVMVTYTENPDLSRLIQIFRNIATQENRVFEIETIRANDPISTPAQLRLLEGELKSRYIADPRRFVQLLQEIRVDEAVPLIARNHAVRLLQMIEKSK